MTIDSKNQHTPGPRSCLNAGTNEKVHFHSALTSAAVNCPACGCPDHFDTLSAGDLVYVCASCSYSWRPTASADPVDNAATSPLQSFFAVVGTLEV